MVRFNLVSLINCLLLLWISHFRICASQATEECNCIPVKQCGPILNFISSIKKPVPAHFKEELNKYVCSNGPPVQVCCPSKAIDISSRTTEESENTDPKLFENPPPPPDVSDHKNLKLLPEDCGDLDFGDKIRNGINAKLNEFPWMALLSYKKETGPEFSCGGAILNEHYILTAAHCIALNSYPLLGVRVGEFNLATKVDCEIQENGKEKCAGPVQDVAIEEVIPHPKFSENYLWNDIGLLRVSKMNLSRENVRPVCLPTTEEIRTTLYNTSLVTGWGRVNNTHKASQILQRVELPIVNLTTCQQNYKNVPRVKLTYKNLCAGGRDEMDSCKGDSGGPLHIPAFINDDVRLVQYGIVSFGHRDCGLAGFPGVYTKLVYYIDWILDNIKP